MAHAVAILIILGNLHTKVVTPLKPPCCISKTRFISLSWGEPTALVSLDLSDTFNTINYTTLLNCLKPLFGVWHGFEVVYINHQFQAIKLG